MTTPSVHTHLLVAALLLALPPALCAADGRAPGWQTQAPQAALPIPPRLAAAVSPAHRQRPPVAARQSASSRTSERAQRLSTSLNVQDVIIDTYPGAPFTIVRTFDGTRLIIQFLPLTPPLGVVPPLRPARITSSAPAHAPFIAAVLGEPAPLAANVPAARPALPAPAFASPVPGKPGCVYPPGARRVPANIVDVTGQHPGTRMRDPVTNVIFLVP